MILKILIILFVLYFYVAVLINGLFMLVSPRAWFRLPLGLKASGSLSARKYSSGWGAVEVRVAGAAVLGLMTYMFHRMFIANYEGTSPSIAQSQELSSGWSKASRFVFEMPQMHNALNWIAPVFMWILIIGLTTNALFMLISPHTWFRLPPWIRGRPGIAERLLQQDWGIIFMRISGAFFLLVAMIFVYAYFSSPR